MKDRFKFRVWFNKLIRYSKNTDDLLLAEDGTLGAFDTVGCYSKDDVVIEQCTGQRDINRKLIYEGDILKDRGNARWKVIWDDDEVAFCVVSGRKGFVYYLSDFEDCEVIGNIHENPELLKEEQ